MDGEGAELHTWGGLMQLTNRPSSSGENKCLGLLLIMAFIAFASETVADSGNLCYSRQLS